MEIADDMIQEDMENFFLDLTTQVMLDQVTVNPAVAEVTINDDDGESSSDVFPQHNRSHTVCSLTFLPCGGWI